MKVWIPYIAAGSGSDVSTCYLAAGLEQAGVEVVLQPFHRYFEFMPRLLSRVPAPANTNITLTNSWNGFAFYRSGIRLVVVDRLFILDPLLEKYKSFTQRLYHKNLIRHYIQNSLKIADSVVAVSNYTADVIKDVLRVPKPSVILNSVDTDFFSPPTYAPRKSVNKPVRLLFSGNLIKRKGVDLLAPIMRNLGKEFELYYTAGLRKHNLPDGARATMHPLGKLSQGEMRDQYRKADLLLFPTRGEGLSRAVMEALACGTPVVASDISSMPEAITPEVGCLCPVDNVQTFVDAVKRLVSNSDHLYAMRLSARVRAEQVFDLNRMVKEYLELFERLLEKKF